jgi:hypothetical protein
MSGPGTYNASDLLVCGNPCQIPIVLQLEDLEIHLQKFWYGPALPSTGATYTLETGMGTFTLTCPADDHEKIVHPTRWSSKTGSTSIQTIGGSP